MIAHDYFRMTLEEAIRRLRRSEAFRSPTFCVAELFDPCEPEVPFVMQAPLAEVETEWHFHRDAIPDYIRVTTGRAARERCLLKLKEEYGLNPTERYQRFESTIKTQQYNPGDSNTWNTGFFVSIEVPAELSGEGCSIFWCGNRSVALSDPRCANGFSMRRPRLRMVMRRSPVPNRSFPK